MQSTLDNEQIFKRKIEKKSLEVENFLLGLYLTANVEYTAEVLSPQTKDYFLTLFTFSDNVTHALWEASRL